MTQIASTIRALLGASKSVGAIFGAVLWHWMHILLFRPQFDRIGDTRSGVYCAAMVMGLLLFVRKLVEGSLSGPVGLALTFVLNLVVLHAITTGKKQSLVLFIAAVMNAAMFDLIHIAVATVRLLYEMPADDAAFAGKSVWVIEHIYLASLLVLFRKVDACVKKPGYKPPKDHGHTA